MKHIFFTIAIITSITACSKPETPNPEPESIPESYVGYKRSEHPNIKIPGISVNDTIVCDLKSACSYFFRLNDPNPTTDLFSEMYTHSDFINYYHAETIQKAEIGIFDNKLYILRIYNNKDIYCEIADYSGNIEKTANIESFKTKEIYVLADTDNDKIHTCGFDVEITMTNSDVIEVVYYGETTSLLIY